MADHKNNAVGWFEIPVADMDRAVAFYETVFETKLVKLDLGPLTMATFPRIEGGSGTPGALVRNEQHYRPSENGALLYFTAHSGDLNNELSRVEGAGGKVLMPRRQISEEFGFMALALDSEGNRIAIHSRQ